VPPMCRWAVKLGRTLKKGETPQNQNVLRGEKKKWGKMGQCEIGMGKGARTKKKGHVRRTWDRCMDAEGR